MKVIIDHWWRVLPFIITAVLIIYLTITFTRWQWLGASIVGVLGGLVVDYIFSHWLQARRKRPTRRKRIKTFLDK